MKEQSDAELLRAYVKGHSEAAFGVLVRRYAPLVHSAALRMLRDPHMAQDVTQRVFVALARNARNLLSRAVLAGWLHTTARNIAAETIRNDARRRAREEDAAGLRGATTQDAEATWEQVAAELDPLLGKLKESEREVLLLRFFENYDLRRIGDNLGISENAAQKRVSRALDRLRWLFEDRGITISAAGLGAMVAANSVQAVPSGLIPALCGTSALCAVAPAPFAFTQIMTMSSLSKSLVVAVALLAGSTGVYEVHRAGQFRDQLRALRGQEDSLRGEVERLTRERDDARRELASSAKKDGPSAQGLAELLRLRREVTGLRAMERERERAQSTTGTWESRIQTLKRRLDQMPGQRIPELAFLSDKDWAAATRNADLTTDTGVREALRDLRSAAKGNFLEALKNAIRDYVAEKSGQPLPDGDKAFADLVNANPSLFPKELSELKRHIALAVDDGIFERYQFTRPAKLNEWLTDILVKEVAPPADDEYDSRHEMGLNSGSVGSVNRIADSVAKAAKSYAEAHQGKMPDSPEQITPYLSEPQNPETVKKYLSMTGVTKQTVSAEAHSGQN